MKFFVAKVNLKEQAKTGFTHLRPLQFAFESREVHAADAPRDGQRPRPAGSDRLRAQRIGRVESTNYRTVKLPANMDLPIFVRGEFNRFYKAMFTQQAKREDYRVVFTEYFWDMSWCDPCAGDPLSPDELRKSGVFWLDGEDGRAGPSKVMLTRLHVRYTPPPFPRT